MQITLLDNVRAAPFINAAKAGLVLISGNGVISQGPEEGPIFFANAVTAMIAGWERPAIVQARVSRKKSLVRATTSGGMSS